MYRQNDKQFIALLQNIRIGRCPPAVADLLMKTSKQEIEKDGIRATKLYTHKGDVEATNWRELEGLPGAARKFQAQDSDPQMEGTLDSMCPVGKVVELKVGAQVRREGGSRGRWMPCVWWGSKGCGGHREGRGRGGGGGGTGCHVSGGDRRVVEGTGREEGGGGGGGGTGCHVSGGDQRVVEGTGREEGKGGGGALDAMCLVGIKGLWRAQGGKREGGALDAMCLVGIKGLWRAQGGKREGGGGGGGTGCHVSGGDQRVVEGTGREEGGGGGHWMPCVWWGSKGCGGHREGRGRGGGGGTGCHVSGGDRRVVEGTGREEGRGRGGGGGGGGALDAMLLVGIKG